MIKKSIVDYATFESLLTVDWNKSVNCALQKMKELPKPKSCLFIVDREGNVLGIVTERDKPSNQTTKEFCEDREFKTVSLQKAKLMDSRMAAEYMLVNKFRRIVIKDGESMGIFTSTDFIKMVAAGD